METILLAVDENDKHRLDEIVETIVGLADPSETRVALTHVFEADDYAEARERLSFRRDDEATPDDVAKRYEPVREVGDALEAAGVEFSWHGAVGDEGDEIVRKSTEIDADLVVVSGRKRSPTGKAVFGSTAQQVMMNAPCPVTFVRNDESTTETEESSGRALLSRTSR